ncbi:zinc finger CCHC domain-containing protein 8 [Silurus meridionalis]|nr:zinc finger CCHC domain-containing protein 8 [Silurus meridionalis]
MCFSLFSLTTGSHEELKRKLQFSSRPKGLSVVNPKVDGPLCQILFGNNVISKQCRQDIEDHIFSLIQQHQQNNDQQASALHPQPQNSSFFMEENQEANGASTAKHVQDAFCVVGSVLYFTTFCLDKLGQPLLNENPQQTDGWEVPKYQQVFAQIITLEGQEMQVKEKRPKPCCFNCGVEGHQLRDCPKPKDMARINAKRKEFAQTNHGNTTNSQRYHVEEVEERFSKYKPGVVSKELLDALGIATNMLPPFIYRMRELGYPPGWLKEAETENSGLMLYDGKTSGDEDSNGTSQNVCYDVSKLVDFPGFNVAPPPNVRDDYRSFGSIPMQPQHWKPTFADQLSNMYPSPDSKCMKRCHDPDLTPPQTKKRRSHSDVCGSSDMDTDSDYETPKRDRFDDFQFQPPLPPGSPLVSTPPPLPLGTPPVTPTPPPLPKGTPPPTPPTNAGSPVLSGRSGAAGEESEDGLTLEELEEQQRLLWAALENADTGTSDSDTGAAGTPGMSSPPSASPPAEADPEVQKEVEESESKEEEGELSSTPGSPAEEGVSGEDEDKSSAGPGTESLNEDPGAESPDELIVLDEVTQSNDSDPEKNQTNEGPEETGIDAQAAEDIEEPVVKKIAGVPHRSNFAEGIIPFEDTPEFTEVAEATGVYLRIRDLLKESPRNQAKNRKLSS